MDVSTVAELEAKSGPESRQPSIGEAMARLFMIVAAGGLLLLVGGGVYLGTFPPTPASHAVEKVLSNASFHPH